ncbi:DUF503 domain-containing protein [Niameybacter massiliensis]|uniref:DUF503 domain-containing protein n=1 Tax=Holtiella tumoricola TaxID=3018743 RepID=A0AA42DKA3_9FIRM|nr:DUF503 domain-containing protein [Holtiella tumoricola]MDA3730583.1 DUF503 domain-containing protein [Holtiella tumoricola]
MVVGMCKLKLYAPWVHSLKEKRMIIRSLLGKVRSKFSISIAEVEAMDVHQTVIIGFSIVTNETKAADAIINQIIGYIEENTEADLLDIEREIISDF